MTTELLANFAFAAALLAVIGYGFALTYKTFGFFNLSHASAILMGAYAKAVLDGSGLPPVIAATVSLVIPTAVFYILAQRVIYPIADEVSSRSVLLVLGLGIASIVTGLVKLCFGPLALPSGTKYDSSAFRLCITLGLIATLSTSHVLLTRTQLGREIQAVSQNWELSRLFGIDVRHVASISFAAAGSGAAVVGLVLAYESDVSPLLGLRYMLMGAAGGLIGLHPTARNPLVLAAVGGAVVGALNELAGIVVPSEFRDLATGAIIVITVVISQYLARGSFIDERE